jgi:hypothetical protein
VFPAAPAHHGIVSGQHGPQGEKGTMKKTLLAIALGVATMPLTFAQTTPAPAPAQNPPAKTNTKKKHVKKPAKKTPASTTTPKSDK